MMNENMNPLHDDSVESGPESPVVETRSRAGNKRRRKAAQYRQLYLLPRFVVEDDGSKRKLEAGEYHKDSHLYSIWTPIADLSDFGIGIGMYFTTLQWLGCMLFFCGLIQLPISSYFESRAYDAGSDRVFKTLGSAACSTETRVCLDPNCRSYAGEFRFPSKEMPRFAPDYKEKATLAAPGTPNYVGWKSPDLLYYDDDTATDEAPSIKPYEYAIGRAEPEIVVARDKLTVGKRGCQLRSFFGASDFIMMIFATITLLALGKRQNDDAERLDLAEQTAQDYSVMIEDPFPEHTDPDIYQTWFEERFGKKTVFSVTVCLNNGPLLRLFAQKRAVEYQMYLANADASLYAEDEGEDEGEGGGGAELERASPGGGAGAGGGRSLEDRILKVQRSRPFLQRLQEKLGLLVTVESLTLQLLQVNMEISKLKQKQFEACKVFIIFNTEKTQREVLERMACGIIPALLDRTDVINPHYLFHGNLLAIREAPEPSAVIYENLHHGFIEHCKEQLISWSILTVGLIITYFAVSSTFNQGQTALGAILISVFNFIFPQLNKFLAITFETHHTTEDLEDSFMAKTVVARAFCSVIIVYVVGRSHASQILTPYFIGSIQAVMLADAFTSPTLRFLDLAGLFKRHVLARLAATDQAAKFLHTGTDYMLAERYTDNCKSLLNAFFFSAIFPVGYFYVAFDCFLSFWADKYCILRVFQQQAPTGDRLVRVSRTFTACIILIHSVVTAHFYYGWPFDGLCPALDVKFTPEGLARAEFIGASTELVYKQCDQLSRSLLPSTSSKPWYQMDGTQQELVVFYNAVAVLVIVYIVVSYFGFEASASVYALFYYKHSNDGATKDVKYEDVGSGEGFVPQFFVEGLTHSALAVAAPNENLDGGLEFDPYLLNWTPSGEDLAYMRYATGEGQDEDDAANAAAPSEDEHGGGLSPEELSEEAEDEVLRAFNVYFDGEDQSTGPKRQSKPLFSRSKQYLGTFAKSAAAFAAARKYSSRS